MMQLHIIEEKIDTKKQNKSTANVFFFGSVHKLNDAIRLLEE